MHIYYMNSMMFVFISSTAIQGEIKMFLQSIRVQQNDDVGSGDDTVFLSLAEKLGLSIDESIVSLALGF